MKQKCSYSGCFKLSTSTFCEQHKPKYVKDAFYSSHQWRKHRKYFLQVNPFCVSCEKKGKIEVATVVDHIQEINDGGDRWDWNNLQPLCVSHHNSKTNRRHK